MTSRIGAYLRISLDNEGEALGVARQLSDARRAAKARDWVVSHVYEDNGISAYKRSVVRPQFEQMITDLKSGQLDGIVAYDLDRLWRQPQDLERIIDIYAARPALKFATVQGDVDLSTSDGRTMARIMVAIANKSSSDTSRRVKRKIQEQAENGKPHWGRLPFGYNRDGTLNPLEAPIVRDMGMWFLNGYSYKEITWRLNEAGRFTRAGKPWFDGTIRQFMIAERFAAIRKHNGVEYPGTWQPIFTRDEWASIQYTVKARKERYKGRPQSKKYLLTSVLTCGGCGSYLHGMTKRDRPGAPLRRTYQCSVSSESERRTNTCGGVCVGADAIEHFVREAVCFRLDTPDLASLLGTSKENDARLHELLAETDQLNSRKNALVDDYADGTLTKADYSRARTRIESKLADVDSQIDKIRRARFDVSLNPGETIREAWLTRSNGWCRELIGTVASEVVVNPSKKKPYYDVDGKRVRFHPERVVFKWDS